MSRLSQLWLMFIVTFLLFSCAQGSKFNKVESQPPVPPSVPAPEPEPVIEAPVIIEDPDTADNIDETRASENRKTQNNMEGKCGEGKCGGGKLKVPNGKNSHGTNDNEFISEEEEIKNIQDILLNGGDIDDLPATAAGSSSESDVMEDNVPPIDSRNTSEGSSNNGLKDNPIPKDNPPPADPTTPSTPETEQLTPEEQTIKSLVKGNLAFNVPPEISIDEIAHIQLLLDLEKTQKQLKQQITVQGEQHSAQVTVYKRMFAHLTSIDFKIDKVSPELQLLTRGSTTKWQWAAKPLTEGVHSLNLAVSIAIQVDGETTYKLIETFDRVIKVKVSGISKVLSFFENNWQWLWATFLVPIAAWLWKKRQVAD